jgi:hypothetical protein
MSESLRARASEQAEAEAAVEAVMRREVVKAEKLAAAEGHRRRKPIPVPVLLLLVLLALNTYLWAGNPGWLTWQEPPAPSIDFYGASYKIAVYLQRQRIEEYRQTRKRLPVVAKQAGLPVHGVSYTPLPNNRYRLAAGRGAQRVVYTSTDSLAVFLGRTLIQQGLLSKGVR